MPFVLKARCTMHEGNKNHEQMLFETPSPLDPEQPMEGDMHLHATLSLGSKSDMLGKIQHGQLVKITIEKIEDIQP